MTFAEVVELSRGYINDKKVVNFIENNNHVLSISTISDPVNSNFGLEIETSSKDVSAILMRNGMKLSDGTIIKIKVTYKKEEISEEPKIHKDGNVAFGRMPSFGKGLFNPSSFSNNPMGPSSNGENERDPRMGNRKFEEFVRSHNNHENTWMGQQASSLEEEFGKFGFDN